MGVLALVPGLPLLPVRRRSAPSWRSSATPFRAAAPPSAAASAAKAAEADAGRRRRQRASRSRRSLRIVEIELVPRQAARGAAARRRTDELAHRVAKMRRKFAEQYGFVVPEIKLSDDLSLPPKSYQIRIHGTVVREPGAAASARCSIVLGDGPQARRAGRRDARAGLRHEGACGSPDAFASEVQARGLQAGRQHLGAADASQRGHPQQPRAAPVLQGHALAARPAGAGIQAPDRRDLPVADLLFRPAGGAEAAARRARLDPQPAPHPRGRSPRSRRMCAAPSRSSSTCACAWRSRSAATRRRTACSRSCASATAGTSPSTRPEARRQGRRHRVRHRSAPGRAVRRRGRRRSIRERMDEGAAASCWSRRPTRGPMCA